MTVHLDADSRAALAAAYLAKLDAGAGPCTLALYSAPMAANTAEAITAQTLFGTLSAADPAGTVVGSVLTLAAFGTAAALASGTAAWARLRDANGVTRGDFDVTDLAGAGAVRMESTDVAPGRTLRVVSFVLTFGS
jgi:hypothetical protein